MVVDKKSKSLVLPVADKNKIYTVVNMNCGFIKMWSEVSRAD